MSIKGVQTMEHERVSFNLARMKKAGQNFEIAVDADLALDFRSGKSVDIMSIIKSEKIFSDVKKGTLASEHLMNAAFGTSDPLEVSKILIKEGEIQLTEEHRKKMREAKKRRIVEIIRRNGVDPKTRLPHPALRIENAMEEAKITINEFKSAEDQIDDIVKKLRVIIPLSMETRRIMVKIPSEFAGKAYSTISQFAKPQKEEWMNDGSYKCDVEIAAGMEADLYEKINALTHGTAQTKVLEK